MKNLFIDTNVYLTFYHFSSDELEELKKSLVAVERKRIRLYITEQVINEFKRNREAKIADALKRFTDQTLPDQFPQICKAYDEYNILKKILRRYSEVRGQLLEKLEVDENIIERAKIRVMRGNPPGKINSYGDSINWGLLLENVPNDEDLHLVTEDQDYTSKIAKDKLTQFLDWE